MSNVLVNSTSGLEAALAGAQAGDTVFLAPGTYSGLYIANVNPGGTVNITSQSASTEAVLQNFTLANSSNLNFSNLELSTVGSTDPLYAYRISSDTNIQFNSLFVHGAIGADPNTSETAFFLRGDTNVSITNSNFEYLLTAITHLNDNGLVFSGNNFQYLAGDGIDGGGSSNVQVLNNYETNAVADTVGVHPDFIQFWTYGTTTDPQNIVIENNTFVRGSGAPVQGIFIGDDTGVLPFQNLTISGNVIAGGMYNGIDVTGANQVNISNNVVAGYSDMESWIRLGTGTETNVTLSNNQAQTYIFDTGAVLTGLVQINDQVIGPTSPGVTLTPPGGAPPVSPPPPPPSPPAPIASPPPPPSPLPPVPPVAPSGLTLDHSTDSGTPGDNLTNIPLVQIDGVAMPGSTVTLLDGATAIGTGAANASTGAFSITANSPLADGAHTLTATAANSAGVSAPSAGLTVTIDTHAPPAATFAFATAVPTNAGETVTLAGTTGAGVPGAPFSVAIFQDGTQIGSTTPTNGTWSFQALNVSATPHTYTVQTTDAAGNTAPGTNDVVVGAPHASIIAGDGTNLIVGAAGDTITGGAGSNTFIVNSLNQAPAGKANPGHLQTITNWVSGSDHFDLTGLGPLTFGGETQTVTPHSVEWYTSGGNTFVVGDAVGRAHADFTIELLGVHNLTSSDFLLG